MTGQEQATVNNYKTLACEVVLKAFNDLTRGSIDLYTLENPDENDVTRDRFVKIANRVKTRVVRYYRPEHRDGDKIWRYVKRELPLEEDRIRATVHICRLFFSEPHPLCGLLGIDGQTILNYSDRKVQRWLAGEKVKFHVSSRGTWFDEEEEA